MSKRFKEGLDLGGAGPIRLLAGETYTGEFFAIAADGADPLVIASLEGLDNASDWDATTLASGQELLAGETVITSITITSGSGWAYRV
jgi:hypothetical protein